METADLLQLIGQAGITGGLIWGGIKLHLSAVNAHSQRADDWKATAELHARRADEAVSQVLKIVEAVRAGTGAGAGAGAGAP